ncbi:MAG: hypothetical protein ACR2G5_02900 [Pyrinomonadaceae bacterium]
MSTVQFRALIQQAKQLSPEERRQLMRYLAESEVAERGPSGGPEEGSKSVIDYVPLFGSGRGAFATADEADAFIRQERDAWEN